MVAFHPAAIVTTVCHLFQVVNGFGKNAKRLFDIPNIYRTEYMLVPEFVLTVSL